MTIKLLGAQDQPAYDQDGKLVRWRIVTYEVDGLGPFGIDGPAEQLTTDEIHRRIRAEAVELRRLVSGL